MDLPRDHIRPIRYPSSVCLRNCAVPQQDSMVARMPVSKHPACSFYPGGPKSFVIQLQVDDFVAVFLQVCRFDAAWDRLPAVEEKDGHTDLPRFPPDISTSRIVIPRRAARGLRPPRISAVAVVKPRRSSRRSAATVERTFAVIEPSVFSRKC